MNVSRWKYVKLYSDGRDKNIHQIEAAAPVVICAGYEIIDKRRQEEKIVDGRLTNGCYADIDYVPIVHFYRNCEQISGQLYTSTVIADRFPRRLQEIFTRGCRDLWL